MSQTEVTICGISSVRARFRRDAQSIIRLYFDLPTSKKVGVMCRALAAARKIYRCVEPAELEKIAGSVHHGGIVAVARQGPTKLATAADAARWARSRENLVALDRIGNAHNLGAIARTAAFYGVPRLLLSGGADAARPGDAAYRVAEGGLDCLEVWFTEDLASFLKTLSASGFQVVGSATRGGARLARGQPDPAPWAIVLGNEEHGLAPSVQAACSRLVTLAGSGQVESLNVSVSAAILIHAMTHPKPRR